MQRHEGLASCKHEETWAFPKIKGTLLGVHTIRIIVFSGLQWGARNHMGVYSNVVPS